MVVYLVYEEHNVYLRSDGFWVFRFAWVSVRSEGWPVIQYGNGKVCNALRPV